MSKYIIDIDTLDNVTVITLSENIPLIYNDAIEWMETKLFEQLLDIPDGEYFAKLLSEPELEKGPFVILDIKVNNKHITVI